MKTIKFNGKPIGLPNTPKFLFAPDESTMELYIVHIKPYSLIWVHQSTPAQLFILVGKQDEAILREAGEFYKEKAIRNLDKN
jgi:hypothetical protein